MSIILHTVNTMPTAFQRIKLFAVFVSLLISGSQAWAISVSPPSWWIGMKHNSVDLILHHTDIAWYVPETNYPGVSITEHRSTGSKNYLLIRINIAKDTQPGLVTFNLTAKNQSPLTFEYLLQERTDDSAQREGFDASDVIYLITPDRFANGSLANDSVDGYVEKRDREYKGGRHGGDIAGITQNLDYLSKMGFTQIWTMPLLENAMPRYSYHGYSTTDYFKIDPRFGSNEDYKNLSLQAAEKGIGVIKDVVLNHIGSEHAWIKDRPSDDWVNHEFTFVPTSHRREALHDPHGVKADAQGHTDGWFSPTMPDLNQRNNDVATYLTQHAIWWIEYAQLSGLRVDTYSYSDKDFLTNWTKRIMDEYPNLTIVGEEWSTNPLITSYWQKGSIRHDNYQTSLPSVMDFPLQVALIDSLVESERWDTGLRKLYETLASDFVYGDPYNLVVFADNHDMSRVTSQLNDDYGLWDMAMTILLTTRGIPQIFYGTEILMNNPGTDDHGIIRSDFPGGFEDDIINAFTRKGLSEKQNKAQQRMQLLLNNRKQSKAIAGGNLVQYTPDNGTYVYFRKLPNERTEVMVAVNKNHTETRLSLNRFAEQLQGITHMTRWRDGENNPLKNHVILPAKSATVWTLN